MKLCRNCSNFNNTLCRIKYTDPSSGADHHEMKAIKAREVGQYCGLAASHFSKKVSNDKLHLEVTESNTLRLVYKKEYLGLITSNGKCSFLKYEKMINARQLWLDNGSLVDMTPVSWLGIRYALKHDGCLYSTINKKEQYIYNVYECIAYSECKDTNLLRLPDNGKVILF